VDRQSARPGCQPGRWLAAQIDHGRILANLQLASHPVSPGLVVVIVAWAIILFFGMGLLAHVAFAIFLIPELGLPYTGLLRVSPAALQEAIRRRSPILTSRSRLPTLPRTRPPGLAGFSAEPLQSSLR
jgi:hypothetical protein